MNYSQIVSFIWGVADLIRDTFKRGKYQDVILPLTVLRRLDCVLAPTKAQVLQRQAALRERGLEDLRPQLCAASGFAFYNTSQYDFARLTGGCAQRGRQPAELHRRLQPEHARRVGAVRPRQHH